MSNLSRTFSVNTLAHFWTLKAFLPEMIKLNKGHIVCYVTLDVTGRNINSLQQINMASVAGMVGMAQMSESIACSQLIKSLF